jgi:hypothetical protein
MEEIGTVRTGAKIALIGEELYLSYGMKNKPSPDSQLTFLVEKKKK